MKQSPDMFKWWKYFWVIVWTAAIMIWLNSLCSCTSIKKNMDSNYQGKADQHSQSKIR